MKLTVLKCWGLYHAWEIALRLRYLLKAFRMKTGCVMWNIKAVFCSCWYRCRLICTLLLPGWSEKLPWDIHSARPEWFIIQRHNKKVFGIYKNLPCFAPQGLVSGTTGGCLGPSPDALSHQAANRNFHHHFPPLCAITDHVSKKCLVYEPFQRTSGLWLFTWNGNKWSLPCPRCLSTSAAATRSAATTRGSRCSLI